MTRRQKRRQYSLRAVLFGRRLGRARGRWAIGRVFGAMEWARRQ